MKHIKKLILFIITIIPIIMYDDVFASTAQVSLYSSSNKITVGDSVTYTVKVSSSSLLGSLVYNFSYDANKLTLTSGTLNAAPVFTGSEKEATYIFKFKAKASGDAKVSFNINELIDWDGNSMNVNKTTSKNISIITQKELNASYSSNNNLSSLSVNGFNLTPAFNKNTLSYSLELENNVREITINCSKEDRYSYVSGCDKKSLEEGLNKIDIKVTAQNGSSKTYTINVTVKELEPINVSVNNEEFTVVRKKENITLPNSNFEEGIVTIDEKEVPMFINNKTNTTLVGLKNKDGEIALYSYKNGNYTKYVELKNSNLIITEAHLENVPYGYKEVKININDIEVVAYEEESNKQFYLLKGTNVETGEENVYQYDSKEKTLQLYNESLIRKHEEAYARRKKIDIIIMLVFALILFATYLTIIIKYILNKKNGKMNKKKNKVNNKNRDYSLDIN